MDYRLDGKVALVTGSDRGIGRGIAETFAANGADILVTYFENKAGAEETAAAVVAAGRRAEVAQVDVGNEDEVARMFARLDDAFGRINILVNNAGVSIAGALHEIPVADWERVLRTNLYGAFFCARQAIPRMIAEGNGGRIINISSVHEEACWSNAGAYCVSKAGLRNLTRTLAIELGEHGITANDIAPGMIVTPMNRRAMEDANYLKNAAAQIVLRRAGAPADVAAMALFLASDAGSYCTGATYFVDGGWMLTWPPV
ncbi:MAG: SDR family oxidoreductase [Thermomicrobiales bacterium]